MPEYYELSEGEILKIYSELLFGEAESWGLGGGKVETTLS